MNEWQRELFRYDKFCEVGVFRCPPASTIQLEAKLIELGWKAFTPIHWLNKRLPRRKARVWEQRPVMSSFLFLDIREDLYLAMRLSEANVVGVRPMMDQGRIVAVGGEEYQRVLDMDTRHEAPTAKPTPPRFNVGEEVVLGAIGEDGPAELLTALVGEQVGVVEKVNAFGEALVAIKNSTTRVWISGYFLARPGV